MNFKLFGKRYLIIFPFQTYKITPKDEGDYRFIWIMKKGTMDTHGIRLTIEALRLRGNGTIIQGNLKYHLPLE